MPTGRQCEVLPGTGESAAVVPVRVVHAAFGIVAEVVERG